MPAIRVENRPFSVAANAATVVFGPWPRDVLVRSLIWNWSYGASGAIRLQRVSFSLTENQGMLEIYESGEFNFSNDAAARSGFGFAFPGAYPSPRYLYDGAGIAVPIGGTNMGIAIAIPYNLIVPQRGRVTIAVDNAQPNDTLSNAILTLEYGARDPALPKPGGPRSSKNNP